MTAEEYYRLGNDYRRRGQFKEAMDAYAKAVSLDPDSPAAVAKHMLEEQYAFFFKDYYNP
jgi:cytochrome c-type biogenesis protein CcmH/NrfG